MQLARKETMFERRKQTSMVYSQVNYHVVLLGLYHAWQQNERIEAKARISEGEIRFLIEADCCTIFLTYLNKFSAEV